MNMRKLLLFALTLAAAMSCQNAPEADLPWAVAHRGCWLKDGEEFYINENCPAGVRMAAIPPSSAMLSTLLTA